MILLFKVGTKFTSDPASGWRDGQIVKFCADDERTKWANCLCGIKVPAKYDTAFPDVNNEQNLTMKSYLSSSDSSGRYKWDNFYDDEDKVRKTRDWFIDFKWLLDQKFITQSDFESIYDFSKRNNDISIDRDFTALLNNEDEKTRLVSDYYMQKGSIASGTHLIGAGETYEDVQEFEAVIAATLTNDLIGEVKAERLAASTADITFDTNTDGNLLHLTAASGAEHSGVWSASKAIVEFGGYDDLIFDESTDGHLANVRVSKLQFDLYTASGSSGIRAWDCGATLAKIDRNIIKGDSDAQAGIHTYDYIGTNCNVLIANNVIYDIGSTAEYAGIRLDIDNSVGTINVFNNTVIGCHYGIGLFAGTPTGTINIKNNLLQDNTTDYSDANSGATATERNVTEDSTSPDDGFGSVDMHTTNDVFKDFASDDFRLDPDGHRTNLLTLMQGSDLSDTFTEDIEG